MRTDTATGTKKILIRAKTTFVEKEPERKKSLVQQLRQYVNKQNQGENRLKWIGPSMIIQAVLITPIVALVIMRTGNHLLLWVFCTAAMYLTFIPSLSGLSAKTILSTFLVSILINVMILVTAVGMYIFS